MIETKFKLSKKVWLILYAIHKDEFSVYAKRQTYGDIIGSFADTLIFATKKEAQAEYDRKNKSNERTY